MNLIPIATNMTELTLKDGTRVLFSYQTPVAAVQDSLFYRTQEKWSVTTNRHINKWLQGTLAQVKPQSFFDNLVR